MAHDDDEDDDYIIPAPAPRRRTDPGRTPMRGTPYDPVASMRAEIAVIGEQIESLEKEIHSLQRTEAVRVDRERQSDRTWSRVQWLISLVAAISLASLGTGIRSCVVNEKDIAELKERHHEHATAPYHGGTREVLSQTREDLAIMRTQIQQGNRVNDEINRKLDRIEERLMPARRRTAAASGEGE